MKAEGGLSTCKTGRAPRSVQAVGRDTRPAEAGLEPAGDGPGNLGLAQTAEFSAQDGCRAPRGNHGYRPWSRRLRPAVRP